MLYLIGAGLGMIDDLTLKGYNAIKSSDFVYLESYTSVMSAGIGEYVKISLPSLTQNSPNTFPSPSN